MNRPHLLYIAFAFPPSSASSVYRCTAVANGFVDAGWDVTVLTVEAEIWAELTGMDNQLLEAVDPRINVVHVSDGGSEEPGRRDIRRYSRFRIEAPYIWKEVFRRRSRKGFPEDFHALWHRPASQAAQEIHRGKPVDLVMASASPYVSFKVAGELADVPYVLDYRDAWAFNTFTGAEIFSVSSERGQLEHGYLRGALQSWFVNDPIHDEYARRYPEVSAEMRVVPNGFDPQPGHGRPTAGATAEPRFGYLGTLQYTAVPLAEFLAGWDNAFGNEATAPAHAIFKGKLSPTGLVPGNVLEIFNSGRHRGWLMRARSPSVTSPVSIKVSTRCCSSFRPENMSPAARPPSIWLPGCRSFPSTQPTAPPQQFCGNTRCGLKPRTCPKKALRTR